MVRVPGWRWVAVGGGSGHLEAVRGTLGASRDQHRLQHAKSPGHELADSLPCGPCAADLTRSLEGSEDRADSTLGAISTSIGLIAVLEALGLLVQ